MNCLVWILLAVAVGNSADLKKFRDAAIDPNLSASLVPFAPDMTKKWRVEVKFDVSVNQIKMEDIFAFDVRPDPLGKDLLVQLVTARESAPSEKYDFSPYFKGETLILKKSPDSKFRTQNLEALKVTMFKRVKNEKQRDRLIQFIDKKLDNLFEILVPDACQIPKVYPLPGGSWDCGRDAPKIKIDLKCTFKGWLKSVPHVSRVVCSGGGQKVVSDSKETVLLEQETDMVYIADSKTGEAYWEVEAGIYAGPMWTKIKSTVLFHH